MVTYNAITCKFRGIAPYNFLEVFDLVLIATGSVLSTLIGGFASANLIVHEMSTSFLSS